MKEPTSANSETVTVLAIRHRLKDEHH
jgi:hypothetical protein